MPFINIFGMSVFLGSTRHSWELDRDEITLLLLRRFSLRLLRAKGGGPNGCLGFATNQSIINLA